MKTETPLAKYLAKKIADKLVPEVLVEDGEYKNLMHFDNVEWEPTDFPVDVNSVERIHVEKTANEFLSCLFDQDTIDEMASVFYLLEHKKVMPHDDLQWYGSIMRQAIAVYTNKIGD